MKKIHYKNQTPSIPHLGISGASGVNLNELDLLLINPPLPIWKNSPSPFRRSFSASGFFQSIQIGYLRQETGVGGCRGQPAPPLQLPLWIYFLPTPISINGGALDPSKTPAALLASEELPGIKGFVCLFFAAVCIVDWSIIWKEEGYRRPERGGGQFGPHVVAVGGRQ